MPRNKTKQRRALQRSRRAQAGFTLIEAALTTVIIGVGVLALVESQQAYHRKNEWARRSGMGMLLANEIRELTLPMPMHDPLTGSANLGPEDDELTYVDFDDADDFAGDVDEVTGIGPGTVFDPPINALSEEIVGLDRWSQEVIVSNVLTDNIASDPQPLGTTPMMRMTVTVRYQPNGGGAPVTISQLSWVVTN